MPKIFVLVDDDKDDRELFREALVTVDPSITCYPIGDGEEALERLYNNELNTPTLFLVDINLPEMSGWDFLTRVKKGPYKNVPVVMYSTSSHKRDKDIAIDLGAVCLITKPSDFKILKEIIRVIISALDSDNGIGRLMEQIELLN